MQSVKPPRPGSRWRRRVAIVLAATAVAYALLLIPERTPGHAGAGRVPFEWRRDALWSGLERQFVELRSRGCDNASIEIEKGLAALQAATASLKEKDLSPGDALFEAIETNVFQLAPFVAACPHRVVDFMNAVTAARHAVKEQSSAWDLGEVQSRRTLYRLLFGSRMALEQVLLQASTAGGIPETYAGAEEERSTGMTVEVRGLRLQSGDILLSRGGAATSAMIARANDYPGSFSHVALMHIDQMSGEASVIESLSQRGVVITSLADFLKDKKLRIVVLRLRRDLPSLRKDPLLPHRAAEWMLAEARRRHIPYDFSLDHRDHGSQFCSEVAAAAYESQGVHLWPGLTYISMPAAIGWLTSLGVRHFETKEPADLEYDPQLRIVGEWRASATLFRAHVDDAVTDAMLEAAGGAPLDYNLFLLPVARVMKAFSFLMNQVGAEGPIPEGMSATAALRVDRFQKEHAALVSRVEASAHEFQSEKGYLPPYWELVQFARSALAKGPGQP